MRRDFIVIAVLGALGIGAVHLYFTEIRGDSPIPVAASINDASPPPARALPEPPDRPHIDISAAADTSVPSEFSLGLPIRCTPGVDCWIANYVDMDAGPEARDYACGRLTYDGHKGTDFAVRDLAVMESGIPVLAVAAGTVERVREGVADVSIRETGAAAVRGRECGNGVLVNHGNGWRSQYCHMRKDSVRVKSQQRVAAGETIGMVGLSGRTEFPHIHLQVTRDGTIVDPFAGTDRKAFCGVGPHPLWRQKVLAHVSYAPTMIYNTGFADRPPKYADIRAGGHHPSTLSRDAPALVLWADIFGVQSGDKVTFTITGPDSKILKEIRSNIPKSQARRFIYGGRKRPSQGWPVGTYRGQIVLTRQGDSIGSPRYAASLSVEVR